jgi:hypothetical protein
MKRVKLNHDVTSVLTPKQKYMIESEVASLDASKTFNSNKNESKDKNKINSSTKKKNWIETVVLKSQRSFQEEEFTSFDRSQTPDYFVNKTKSNDDENQIVKFDLISVKKDRLNDEDSNINLTTSNF